MIKEIIMYTVVCDNCGIDVSDGEEYSGWNDKSFIEDIATDFNWTKKDDKHYCPKCFKYDDEDNLIIINSIKENKYKNINTKENYESLLRSGMFWEFHPELIGNWEIDKLIINK